MKTKEKLAEALKMASAPLWMIEKALAGVYDDFESELPAPIAQLVNDAEREKLTGIATQAREGAFDGTREEAEAWARGPGAPVLSEIAKGLK